MLPPIGDASLRDRSESARDISIVGAFEYALDTQRLHPSTALIRLLGWRQDTLPSLTDFLSQIHDEDRDRVAVAFESLSSKQPHLSATFRIQSSGSSQDRVRLQGELLTGRGSRRVAALLMACPLDDSPARQPDLSSLFAREMDHRLNNLVPLIMTLVRITAETSSSTYAFREALEQRLRVLTLASRLAKEVTQQCDLRTILDVEIAPFRQSATKIRFVGRNVHCSKDTAQVFSLIVHELVSNACKHGALREEGGAISASVRIVGDSAKSLRFRWREKSAAGVPSRNRDGLGTLLLARDGRSALGGTASFGFKRDGIDYHLDVPLAGGGTLFG